MNKLDGKSKAKRLMRFGWYEVPDDNPVVKFCQDSGLHGIKYITSPTLHLCERLFWLIAFIMAMSTSSFFIYNTWDQYYNLPMVLVQSPKPLSINQFSFPSVTICGLNRVKKTTYQKISFLSKLNKDYPYLPHFQKFPDIVKILDNLCESSNVFVKTMASKYRKMYDMGYQSAFLNLELSQSFMNESKILKLLKENSQNCDDLILEIDFELESLDAESFLVEKVETDFGFCCTFNTIPTLRLKPWKNLMDMDIGIQTFYRNNDRLYQNISTDTLVFTDESMTNLPRQQLVPGITHGLSIYLRTKTRDFHCSDPKLNGFLVSIAHPLDAPSTNNKLNFIEFSTEVTFTLKPKITLADKSIKRFAPDQRRCYFSNEMTLRDHSVYTKSNCLQECIANLTMKNCQAVADCWNENNNWGSQRQWIYGHICQPNQNCTTNKKRLSEVTLSVADESCKHCLPTCNDIIYQYNKKVNPLGNQFENTPEGEREKMKLELDELGNVSVVHVYFDEYYATPTIRKEQTGIFQLLADSGGLLGLCLGFSGLSILETIYYFTIRVCFRFLRHKLLLRKGFCPDETPNPNDNANEINYLRMIQADNEETIKQLAKSVSTLQQVVAESTETRV